MCSIIGYKITETRKKDLQERLTNNFNLLSHRGEDSFGAIMISSEKITSTKAMGLDTFTDSVTELLKEHNYKYIIAHGRKSSIGRINLGLQHPIITKNEDVEVFTIHNGTNRDLYNLLKPYGGSDTAVMSKIFSKYKPEVDEIVKMLLADTGVVFNMFNNGKLYFHRDSARPLMISEDRNMIASEPHTTGNWMMVKEQDTLFDSVEDFFNNTEVYDKKVECTEKVHTRKCTFCKKTHLHSAKTGGKCLCCEAAASTKTTYNTTVVKNYY